LKSHIVSLRKGYEKWCKDNGYRASSTRDFRAELKRKGFEIKKAERGLEYAFGIGIKDFGETISLVLEDDETQSLMDI
jgi:hypothetical protein